MAFLIHLFIISRIRRNYYARIRAILAEKSKGNMLYANYEKISYEVFLKQMIESKHRNRAVYCFSEYPVTTNAKYSP